jgi:hypoxanthine phosphoribosyltransferase
MAIEYLFVTWPDYHLLAQKLAASILNHSPRFDELIAISRGGLSLGHILSDLLALPISTFSIQSYTDIQSHGEAKITVELTKPIKGKRVLLVDDVADSGKTLERAVNYLKGFEPSEITVVTMFYKPHSVFRPDYFVKQTGKWIIFPYEPTEMIKLITRKMELDGKTKAEIQDFLINLGFREGQIAFTRKHHLNI